MNSSCFALMESEIISRFEHEADFYIFGKESRCKTVHRLSNKAKKYAESIIADSQNLFADEIVNGQVVKIYKSNVDGEFVSFTDSKVELIRIDGNNVEINDKSHKFKVIKKLKEPKKINELSGVGIIPMAIGGNSYVEISNPGGSWMSIKQYLY